MKKYLIIVQARFGSTRFPGKILKKIGKYSAIEILIKRLKKLDRPSKIIVATTKSPDDDYLCRYLKKRKINFFRGSNENVLKRFYDCAQEYKIDNCIRITADCPLIDVKILGQVIDLFEERKLNYACNTFPPTFPDGLDVEIFDKKSLIKTYRNAKKKYDLEHVTSYMRNKKRFKIGNLLSKENFSKLRWTLDEHDDYLFLRELNKKINLVNASYNSIIRTLQKYPSLKDINAKINRNEGAYLNKGQKLWKRAKQIIPGGNMLLSKRSEMFLPNLWPSYFKTSKYNKVTDLDGKKYTDFIFSVGQNILGYRNPIIEKKIIKSLKMGNMTTLNSFEEVQLAEKLLSMHPWFDMVRFARSGGEANAIAIRIARGSTKKQNVAICGYHGWHDWYLAANLKNKNNLSNHLLPGLDPLGVHQKLKDTVYPFEYNDFNSLKSLVEKKNIGIIKMEVSRNFGPKNNFLQKIRNLCNEKNIILIFDECTSGFRNCFGGLHKIFNVKPDMAMFGKALGNGHAVTAVVGKKDIMEVAQKSFISSTFWTERMGSVAGLATLNEMEKIKSWDIITKTGKKIKKNWEKLSKSYNLKITVSGLDALCSFSFKSSNSNKYKTLITQEMLKKKYLASNLVYVSIAHDDKTVDDYFSRLDEIFKLVKKCENHELNIDQLLKTEPAHTTFRRLN